MKFKSESIVFNFVKARFSRAYFKGFRWSNVTTFFEHYSFFEKLGVLLIIAPSFITRIVKFLLRKLKKGRPYAYYKDYLLD